MGWITSKYKLSDNIRRIFVNLSWGVAGKMMQLVSALLVGVLVARYLKPENYGILNYALGYIGLFTLISEFGMNSILVREFSKNDSNKFEIIGTALVVRLLLSLVAIIAIIVSVMYVENDPMKRLYIIIISFNFLSLAATLTFRNFFISQLKNEYIVKAEIIRLLTTGLLKVLMIVLKGPLIYFIIIAALDSLIILIPFLYFFIKNYWSLHQAKFSYPMAKSIIFTSAPLLIEGVAALLYQKIDIVMIGKFINSTEVAYYSVAHKFVEFGIFIPMVLTQTLSPLLVQKLESVNGDRTDITYKKYRQKIGDMIVHSGMFVSVLLFFLASPIISILYGAEYYASIPLLKLLAWKGLFCGLGYTASIVIITEGRHNLIFLTNVVGGALNLILNLLFIPRFGVRGVAWATLISFCVATYIANFFFKKYRNDFYLQTNYFFLGGFRIIKMAISMIKNKELPL